MSRKFSNAAVLSIDEIIEILKSNSEKFTTCPPQMPDGSEVYVYTWSSEETKNDYLSDGHRWIMYGKQNHPKKSPIVKHSYFKLDTQAGATLKFKRHTYELLKDAKAVLIHYSGDSNLSKPFPHRCCQKPNYNHFKTKQSVLETIRETMNDKTPQTIYRDNINFEEHENHLKNTKQISNMKYYKKSTTKLCRDEIYNLTTFNKHTGFIKYFKLLPKIEIIMANENIIGEFNKLFQFNADIYLSYDTKFEMGDMFLSVLFFNHSIFNHEPMIPLAYIYHDRKCLSSHDTFFKWLKETIPLLSKRAVAIVTDRETDISKSIKQNFPHFKNIFCWNHLKRDINYWLNNRSATNDEISFYNDELEALLKSNSKDEFKEKFDMKSKTWASAFVEFFKNFLLEDIIVGAGKWIVKNYDIYNPFLGVTNDQAESLNALIKRIQDDKIKRIDKLSASLHYHQKNFWNEIYKGLHDRGNFKLKKIHSNLKLDSNVFHPPENISLENIFNLIKFDLIEEISNEQSDATTITTTSAVTTDSLSVEIIPKIEFLPDLKMFLVPDEMGISHYVKLFPKVKCTCNLTSCFHVRAAKRSIGMQDPKKKIDTFSELKIKSRKKEEKRKGQKRVVILKHESEEQIETNEIFNNIKIETDEYFVPKIGFEEIQKNENNVLAEADIGDFNILKHENEICGERMETNEKFLNNTSKIDETFAELEEIQIHENIEKNVSQGSAIKEFPVSVKLENFIINQEAL